MTHPQKPIQAGLMALLLFVWTMGAACDHSKSSVRCCECMIDADAFRCALDQDRYDCIGECESVRFRCDEVEKAGCDDECACVD